ncbi:3-ketodihydrosphingosine reductase-like [Lytechinus variegatus]|uniref:3-ketodihydrosphingosine reductase-like n=1 Tax=Lytechinus variegatus TaxID=7654 RepID=UPI001BB13184|nr:3-ketodihydrosphingosine reductase-like [Lytechinus variegatus]
MEASLFLIITISLFVGFLFLIYVLSPLITPKRMKLNKAHVVITGGSSGIGKAVAMEVLRQGASVTLLARNQERLKQAKLDLEKYIIDKGHQKILCISVDLAKDYGSVEQAIAESVEVMGPCDMLINSAGKSSALAFEELEISEFKKDMEVNYLGSVYATRAVLPYMKKQSHGRIVFISSQAGQLGLYGYSSYSGSKFALRGFAEALQMEVKPYDIYVTLNFPPDTDTPMLQAELETQPEETRLISETSGLYAAQDVARIIVQDSLNAVFLSYVGMDGYMLSILTCGMSPVTSMMVGVQQVAFMGLFRVISHLYLGSFDRIIKRCKEERDKTESKQFKDK